VFPDLNLPKAELRLRTENNQTQVFDIFRKKFVMLTSEEWVRQHVLHFLINDKGFPTGLIEVEKSIKLFNTDKRVDVLVRTSQLKPLLLVECKEPGVKLGQKEVSQLARYQITLEATYSFLTNGLQHFIMKHNDKKISYLESLPEYAEMLI
jgi:hypothetical protein